ncbi:MAG: hypothetical protein RLZZ50_614 [Verrucomicrobiota bacterium]
MITYQIISSLLNFLGAVTLGFAVVLRGRGDHLNIRFGFFAFIIGAWSAAYLFWQLSADAGTALFFTRALMLFAYFVPVTFFHFIAELCGERRRWTVGLGYAAAVALSVLNFTPLMVARVEPAMGFPHWPKAGQLYWLYLLLFGLLTVRAGMLLLRALKGASGSRAAQLRNILLAGAVGFGGGATNFPLWYDVPLPPLGNLLVLLYLLIMAHAVSRYRLPLVGYDFVLALVYLGLSVTLSVAWVIGLVILAPVAEIDPAPGELFAHFFAAMLVCLFFFWLVPRLKRVAERILAQTYLRRRRDPQQKLRRLGARLGSIMDEEAIFENVAAEISQAFDLKEVAVYLRSEFDRDYRLRIARGWSSCPESFPLDSVVARVFESQISPIFLDGTEQRVGAELGAELERFAESMEFAAVCPIASDDFLSGFMLLGGRADEERYTEAEIALLEAICAQVAVTLRARQLERRASQTDKLIALGTLAAGLAHEFRNPLTSVQTFAAMLGESHIDPRELRELAAVVRRDVGRITGIVDNISAFADSNEVQMGAVEIEGVLRGVIDIIRPELARTGVEARLDCQPSPAIRGNRGQLVQVFLNLAQNAIQALEGRAGAMLVFTVAIRDRDVPRPHLCVTVEDNGPGIAPDVLPRIFEPFTTTKATGRRDGKQGMGLGLAIVKRIVQHHHGDIQVVGGPGRGAVFHVSFPFAE